MFLNNNKKTFPTFDMSVVAAQSVAPAARVCEGSRRAGRLAYVWPAGDGLLVPA